MTLQTLSPEVEQFIQQELDSGHYSNLEELVEQALLLLIQQTQKQSLPKISLAGTVLHYENPLEPVVDPDEWDAIA
jgi:Arc/MetJ-type ribon-helix-helix transcriptional regulator